MEREMPAEQLLERSEELAELGELLAASAAPQGRVVFVGGEAGIGKTVLLREFAERASASARVLWGACDGLLTPGPLGPFLDIADVTGGELERRVRAGARPYEVGTALIAELDRGRPTVLVVEDLHWADEASLDVIRVLTRRIDRVRSLVLASYRDDGLERGHPLARMLGEVATSPATRRMKLAPLSLEAVGGLAEGHGVDAADLYRRTGGNAFYVTEALAAGTAAVPSTVRDAVLARVARLSEPATRLLDAIAVAVPEVEVWLLEALAPDELPSLRECLASGIVVANETAVSFRHELARLSVLEAQPPDQRVDLHRRALAALADRPNPDLARLADHAEAAGDAAALLRFAPAAATRAASLGAHREAAAQFERALRVADGLPAERQAELFQARAYECYLTGELEAAVDAQQLALRHLRTYGDPVAEGDGLRALSRLYRFLGRGDASAETGRQAVERLETAEPGSELALAYVELAHALAIAGDIPASRPFNQRGLDLAERIGDAEVRSYALTGRATTDVMADAPGAVPNLESALAAALDAGDEDDTARAYLSLVWWPLLRRDYDTAERHIQAGLDYCVEHGLDLWWLFLVPCRARLQLDRGDWTAAEESARTAVDDHRTWPVPRVFAIAVLGLALARRGESGARALVDEARRLAAPTGEIQRLAVAGSAAAEVAWLDGRTDLVGELTEAAFRMGVERETPWALGEVACWRRRAGIVEQVNAPLAAPYAAELDGRHEEAAALWIELGCRYDAALALAGSGAPELLRRALEELQALGAVPAAAIVARRLREHGVTGLPRGPRAATRANPAGLTARELEVLELVADGLRNADIAERLFLSEKTVGHHVSAVLRKLDVRTRGEAGAAARRLGLLEQDR
jgi:ATP/maltotriose-dependent transcriptional regulator MalT